MKKGFIVKENSGLYGVYDGTSIIQCRARGKFRIGQYSPMVGDNVLFDENQNYLMEIEERFNQMTRPSLSNVETIAIVASTEKPRINLSLISRYIVLSEMVFVKPIILLSKIDLCEDNYPDELKEKLEKMGYKVIKFSSKTLEGIDEIKKEFKGKKVVFCGQSGVGKSNLINNLIPGTKQQVQEISDALNRGKHTTRIVEYLKGDDYWIADTPGFSHIEFDLTALDISRFYPGFNKYFGQCKFRDCIHENEFGCAVKDAVAHNEINKEVYEDYLKLLSDIKNKKEY